MKKITVIMTHSQANAIVALLNRYVSIGVVSDLDLGPFMEGVQNTLGTHQVKNVQLSTYETIVRVPGKNATLSSSEPDDDILINVT